MAQAMATSAAGFKEMFRSARERQDLCVVAILAWIASCDGVVAPQERELLEQLAGGLPNLPDVAAVIDAIAPGHADDLELACRHIRNRMDRAGKQLLLQLAITMAVQDGYLTVGENWVLQFLADLLDISPRRFARLFGQVTRRPFPMAGDPSSMLWWSEREAGIPAHPDPEMRAASRSGRVRGDASEVPEAMTRAVALRVLGLDEPASLEQVHRAYRRLARFRHPDRFAKLGPAAIAAATAAFERVREAYEVLSSESLRPHSAESR